MRTAADILKDFGLEDLDSQPQKVFRKRIAALADFTAAYDASFEKLSDLLQRRTRKLREAEERETAANRICERAQMAAASMSAVMLALFNWEAAIGTAEEAQQMADLRETLNIYRHRLETGSHDHD